MQAFFINKRNIFGAVNVNDSMSLYSQAFMAIFHFYSFHEYSVVYTFIYKTAQNKKSPGT